MNLPLAKAKPITHNGSTSGITELKIEKGKKPKVPQKEQLERGQRICERKTDGEENETFITPEEIISNLLCYILFIIYSVWSF